MKLGWKQYHILNNTSKMKTKVLLFSLMFVMSQQVFGYTIKTDTVVHKGREKRGKLAHYIKKSVELYLNIRKKE